MQEDCKTREYWDDIIRLHPNLRTYHGSAWDNYCLISYVPEGSGESYLQCRPFAIGIILDDSFSFYLYNFIGLLKLSQSLAYFNTEKLTSKTRNYPGLSIILGTPDRRIYRIKPKEYTLKYEEYLKINNVEKGKIKTEEKISFKEYFD